MLKIKISDIDKLFELSATLGVVTYLQHLVKYDADSRIICNEQLAFTYDYANSFLFDIQHETVIALRKLIEREDFTIIEK